MITGKDFYNVLSAIVPLYIAMILAYCSVRWWKIFQPEQCSGINRFVAVFAAPFLVFQFLASNNPYKMNFKFIAADALQKVVALVVLFLWQLVFAKQGGFDWVISMFSLSSLPNTLVLGVPLLNAMYGDFTSSLMSQVVAFQILIWNTLLLAMFEYRGAKVLIAQQFPETAAAISSFRVDSDVVSLSGHEPLQADSEIDEAGKLHIRVSKSSRSSAMLSSIDRLHGLSSMPSKSMPPRTTSLSSTEMYSVRSPSLREQNSRVSSLKNSDFYHQAGFSESSPWQSWNLEEEMQKIPRKSNNYGNNASNSQQYPYPKSNKDLHMFVWTSSVGGGGDLGYLRHNKSSRDQEMKSSSTVIGPANDMGAVAEMEGQGGGSTRRKMPRTSVLARLILIMMWRKLIRNPNTHASILGLVWSLIAYRWNIEMPLIMRKSVKILSDTGLGMAMFSLGLFTALQPRLVTCRKSLAALAMGVKFLGGPGIMAATSAALGIRGSLLQVSIVQAALPLGNFPFIFAKEYDLHANLISTSVVFGMVIALPVTIIYFVLLGL